MKFKVEVAFKFDAELGEGPIWDDHSQRLIWLDITRGKLLFYSPINNSQHEIDFGKFVCSVALTQSQDLWLAMRDGFAYFSQETETLSNYVKMLESDDVRFNDGAVDKQGRFLVGTMGFQPQVDTGKLFTFLPDSELKVLLPMVGVSNGICWSKDSSQMFYIDSWQQNIQVFDYNLYSGEISNPQVFFRFDHRLGTPDGMTIDQSGNLWVAMWSGSQILKIDSSGELVDSIQFPVSKVTSLTFGGENLDQLYVTSARYGLSDLELANEPLAGSLFRVKVDTPGFPENRMK